MWRRIRENRHALAKQAMYGHFFNQPTSMIGIGHGTGPCSVSSTEQLAPNSHLAAHYKKQQQQQQQQAKYFASHLSVYDM